jgi:hypothetical protein
VFEFMAMVKHGKAEKWAARSERLSAALRQNLKRRKAQAKSRALARDSAATQESSSEHESRPDADGQAPEPDFRRNRSPD